MAYQVLEPFLVVGAAVYFLIDAIIFSIPCPLNPDASPPEPGINPGTPSFFHERRDHSGSLGSCILFGTDVRRGNPYGRGNNPYGRADQGRP